MDKSSVIGKILIEGKVVLQSPLLIGDGEGETASNLRDVHVLKSRQGEPFIPGTSLCGVLRGWLESFDAATVKEVFGGKVSKDKGEDGWQSSIQADDIALVDGEIISRDGVRIADATGTVDGDGKFDYEAVERGAAGDLRLLINLRACHSLEKISAVVGCMLRKLQDGIQLGALTSKGFGLVRAEDLNASFYDFRDKADVAAWLTGKSAAKKILPSTEDLSASKDNFVVDAEFKFNSSFIIRDYATAATLKSREDFVIPGTSLKGILRHRSEYILRRFDVEANALECLMGSADKKIKSRFRVAESYIAPKNFSEFEHARTKIDRFTGGTLQGSLFTTKPAYQKKLSEPTFKLHFEIVNANKSEAGLAIFLLRDLWFGHVAIGGEKFIGRGTLKGLSAAIKFKGETYSIDADGKVIGNKAELEKFAASLKNFARGDGQ